MNNLINPSILILDFGSQYTELIARRIREMKVYCEIYPYDCDEDILEALNVRGIILSGGPSSATFVENPRIPEWVFASKLPVLGICYGMQTMAAQLGGQVSSAEKCEFGAAKLTIHPSALFDGILEKSFEVWMSHGDHVTKLPENFSVICTTDNTPIAGMANESKRWYGLQFHPEVTHTPKGMELLKQFVLSICNITPDWTTECKIHQLTVSIQGAVGKEKVILALSGGVDSSVVAALLQKVIPKQVHCVFVDTGLLRQDETQQVLALFQDAMGLPLEVIQAESRFLKALSGITCPEKKRKIIGHLFIEVFNEKAKKLKGIHWLAQGTIYPDIIESANASQSSVTIKSHHNVGGLPEKLPFKLLEPIRKLFKDEVRQLGQALGLPYDMVYRHPFPGAGLAVRILGEVKKSYADTLRLADAIFIEELKKQNLYHQVSQAFAVFLPIKSVGVTGDGRRYDYVIALRSVDTIDFMTAKWSILPHDFLAHVSNRIINEVSGVSRVVYDISGKPPATIEWE